MNEETRPSQAADPPRTIDRLVPADSPGKINPEKPWPAPPAPAPVVDDGYKVDEETAENEFARFLDKMDLDPNTDGMSSDEQGERSSAKRTFIKAVRRGSLVVDDKGQPVFTPQRSPRVEPFTFYEPTGASLVAMDKVKKNADVSKTFAVLADVTKTEKGEFGLLKLGDLNVCSAVLTLFMG